MYGKYKSLLAVLLIFTMLITLSSVSLAAKGGNGSANIQGTILVVDSEGKTGVSFSNINMIYLKANNMPDGSYYVQITSTSGKTVLAAPQGTVKVVNGVFENSLLVNLVNFVSGQQLTINRPYKIWVSTSSDFLQKQSKTKTFKVRNEEEPNPTPITKLSVKKFYDANVNGVKDANENFLPGWKVAMYQGSEVTASVYQYVYTPYETSILGTYTFQESDPVQNNWKNTTPKVSTVTLADNEEENVYFGNVTIGEGSGIGESLGYWKNSNRSLTEEQLLALRNLSLRNNDGSSFDPDTQAQFQTWLDNANSADNMAYTLSAHLACLKLNTLSGKISSNAIVYAPTVAEAGKFGFITIEALLTKADAELAVHNNTPAGNIYRTAQEQLKNAIESINQNNDIFVQAAPGTFSF